MGPLVGSELVGANVGLDSEGDCVGEIVGFAVIGDLVGDTDG